MRETDRAAAVAADAVQEAYLVATGKPGNPERIRQMPADGWTPPLLHRITALDAHARAVGATYPPAGTRWAWSPGAALLWSADFLIERGATPEQTMPWLTVQASDPVHERRDAFEAGLERDGSWTGRWAGVSTGLAALAYAAGLTPGEAQDQWWGTTSTVEVERRLRALRALAALRGYRLPSPAD